MIHLMIIAFLLVSSGCRKENDSAVDCTADMLAEYGAVPYNGQTEYCHSLTLHMFEDRQYFSLDCCVCDMLPNAKDCEYNDYFITNGEFDETRFNTFFKKSTRVGIVGVLE